MATSEVNSLFLRAIGDAELRKKILADPVAAGKSAGLSQPALDVLAKANPRTLQAQFDRLTTITKDLGGILEAGYSRDFSDKNVHDKDDHGHDKLHTSLDLGALVSNPAIDAATLKAALKDPVVLREFRSNEKLRNLAKNVLGTDI